MNRKLVEVKEVKNDFSKVEPYEKSLKSSSIEKLNQTKNYLEARLESREEETTINLKAKTKSKRIYEHKRHNQSNREISRGSNILIFSTKPLLLVCRSILAFHKIFRGENHEIWAPYNSKKQRTDNTLYKEIYIRK